MYLFICTHKHEHYSILCMRRGHTRNPFTRTQRASVRVAGKRRRVHEHHHHTARCGRANDDDDDDATLASATTCTHRAQHAAHMMPVATGNKHTLVGGHTLHTHRTYVSRERVCAYSSDERINECARSSCTRCAVAIQQRITHIDFAHICETFNVHVDLHTMLYTLQCMYIILYVVRCGAILMHAKRTHSERSTYCNR